MQVADCNTACLLYTSDHDARWLHPFVEWIAANYLTVRYKLLIRLAVEQGAEIIVQPAAIMVAAGCTMISAQDVYKRQMLTLMVKVMQEIPEGSDILFLTNADYIQNFDKTPTAKSCLLYTSY